jgi:hypothetical protein
MSNPLEAVLQRYQSAKDSLRILERVVNKAIPGAITSRHVFASLPPVEARQRIKDARIELENWVAVALVAAFERAVRDYLKNLVDPRLSRADPFHETVRKLLLDDIEFWHLSARVVDVVFKDRVAGDLCGMVKQILQHRNDVAHGRWFGKAPPQYARPQKAYDRLTAFLRSGGVIPP